jgi:hypothetical protein
MRLPRPPYRLRLRTILILVALVAIGLGGRKWMDRRGRHFRRVAMDYRDMAKLDEISAALGSRHSAPIAAYRRTLQRKYEYAGAHPWLPVEPDPPPPQFAD